MSEEHGERGAHDLGVRFEAENERADIERWRHATDLERSRVIAELIAHAEQVAASTGIRNDEPARRLPIRDSNRTG